MKPQIFIVAGEPSGDTHGAHLVRELDKLTHGKYEFHGLGGPEMANQGVHIHFELAKYPIIGIWGILSSAKIIYHVFTRAMTYLRRNRPKLVILVDYPGFNLQLAGQAKKMGLPVAYYIAPQIWAWWPGRIKRIPKKVDKMLVILPFEKALYEQAEVSAEYVGHPTFDSLDQRDFTRDIPPEIHRAKKEGRLVGLLPGSRTKEIEFNLPMMVRTANILQKKIPGLRFLIGAPNEEKSGLIASILESMPIKPSILVGATHYLMAHSYFCMVTSGTATLELTYFQTPMVIIYRVDKLTSFLGHLVLASDYFGLPNILAGREIVSELLLTDDDVSLIVEKALPLLEDTPQRTQCLSDLAEVHHLLSQKKGATKNAAQAIADMLEEKYFNRP